MTVDNEYIYGPSSTTIYVNNGGSDDWMYGEQTTKNKTLAYTPEIGTVYDGFWPSVNKIIPQCQENMIQSLNAARFSGAFGLVEDLTPFIIQNNETTIKLMVKRLGQTASPLTVSVEPLDDGIVWVGNPVTFNNLVVLQSRIDSIPVVLNGNLKNGDAIRYVLALDNGFYTTYDTIERYFGVPVQVFAG